MRKTTPKLALRKETVRALSTMNLARVVGGQDTDAALDGDATHAKDCPTGALAPRA